MRLIGYVCIAGLLCAAAPLAKAAGEQALGVIEVSQNAHVDGVDAAAGSNFYAGEEFVTFEAGEVRLRVHHCRIDLGATTDARFLPDETPDHLQVIQGSARYSCPAGAILWIETPAGILHGSDGMPASGMIVITDAHNLTISAYDQGLILDNDGELHLIGAGESYRVAVEEESADADAGQPPQVQKKRRRRKLALWLIGGGVAAFAVSEIWQVESESPYKPEPSTKPLP
jgi:hypothetical protein